MAQNWNIEMSQAFYMEVWNGYERSKKLEEENKKLKENVENLKVWVYKNIEWDKRKDYQEFCRENNL